MGVLEGKRALVSGGATGIGAATVARLAAEGASVIACGRTPPEETAASAFLPADVSKQADVARLFEEVQDRLGGLDILVNNAGVQIEKTVAETTDEDWDLLMGVNAGGVFRMCRAAIPVMTQGGGGSIINIGSTAGNVSDFNMAIYNASKAFVHGLTRSIAVDHGHQGIRCNAIAPGWIMTGMADAAFADAKNPEGAALDAMARHPLGRMGTPADIAGMACWLGSDDAGFASGQIFTLDGAMTAGSPINAGLF